MCPPGIAYFNSLLHQYLFPITPASLLLPTLLFIPPINTLTHLDYHSSFPPSPSCLLSLHPYRNDLSFDTIGYFFVLTNNIFTAGNGVYVKKKLESKELGKYGLLFYNSLFMLPFSIVFCCINGDFWKVIKMCMCVCVVVIVVVIAVVLTNPPPPHLIRRGSSRVGRTQRSWYSSWCRV